MRQHTRSLMMGAALASVNLALCLTFYFSRPADEVFFKRWDDMARTGDIEISSADPVRFAERPFYGFSGFHGRDVWWVRWSLTVASHRSWRHILCVKPSPGR